MSQLLLQKRNLKYIWRGAACAVLVVAALMLIGLANTGKAQNEPQRIQIATGAYITPTAAPDSKYQLLAAPLPGFPDYVVDHAETSVVSPDGKTMLVLTSGYNLNFAANTNDANDHVDPANSGEFVFVFDISTGQAILRQILRIPNGYSGIVWAPNGKTFYVAGGQDDNVHVFASNLLGQFSEQLSAVQPFAPIALNHGPDNSGDGPVAAGLGITANGKTLVVANYMHDSISLVDITSGIVKAELDLRPGKHNPADSGKPGGEFPFWVAVKGNSTAYVSSARDREIVVVDISTFIPTITGRIHVNGNPNKMVLNRAQTRLYVTVDNEDALHVIDTNLNRILASVNTSASGEGSGDSRPLRGSNPNSVTLSPDEKIAYVTDSATNALAVIRIDDEGELELAGLIPTGWLPNSVSTSRDGKVLFVSQGKTPAGPNPKFCSDTTNSDARNTMCDLTQEYIFQDMKAALLTIPVPQQPELNTLTGIVAQNNGFGFAPSTADRETMNFLHNRIKHVIYIIKENRTYDQILGDLPVGNGDPAITEFGHAVTPNFHAIATNFVNLDNFYCSGEVSMDGWQWSTSGRAVDTLEKTVPVNYGKGGVDYDSEGDDRSVNVAQATPAERQAVTGNLATLDPDYLPGPGNEMAIDGPSGEEGAGYIWNGALRAGLTIRNYGVFVDELPSASQPYILEPGKTNPPTQVVIESVPELKNYTDKSFYNYDNTFPDFYRFKEWEREFDGYVKNGNLPNFEMLRLMHDHMGHFGSALLGVNTPEREQADNDYAVALLIDKVAHSPYASSTLVFVIEDDAQDGGDHVDAHRSTAYIVGPYVKHHTVVSKHYATVNMVRTMEDILGTAHQNLHDAGVPPMTDVFDITQKDWTFEAAPSAYLLATQLPISQTAAAKALVQAAGIIPQPTHDAAWWEAKTRGMDFSKADHVDPVAFNRVVWQGLKGDVPYPTYRSGADLRQNRAELLRAAQTASSSRAK
jgi:DNA-binding beta-propeller fold protein YncE